MLQYKNRKLSLQHKAGIQKTFSLSGLSSWLDPNTQPDLKAIPKAGDMQSNSQSFWRLIFTPSKLLKFFLFFLPLKTHVSFITESLFTTMLFQPQNAQIERRASQAVLESFARSVPGHQKGALSAQSAPAPIRLQYCSSAWLVLPFCTQPKLQKQNQQPLFASPSAKYS